MAEVNDMNGIAPEISRLSAEIERLKAELAQAREKEHDTEESGRAMLFMLEDLERSRGDIEISKNVWETTFDSIPDPLFIHDKEMMLVRANRAYLAASGETEFKQIIGKPYYEVFPKTGAPLSCCLRAMEKEKEEEEEIMDSKPVSLNEKLAKGIQIDLNDRIAFTKQLFGNSSEDYNRVLNQLITFDTFEETKDFIEEMVKPDYNNWEGKEEYEHRFMEIIEKKFS